MAAADVALPAMMAGFAAGAVLPALAPSPRAVRVVAAIGALAGASGGFVAAAVVLATGRALDLSFPQLAAPAGGIALHLDGLGAIFLALVAAVTLPVAVYGVTYTAAYDDGRHSLRAFGLMFNGFLLAMSLVPCAGNAFTLDRKSTRLNSSHLGISYAVFCLKK